MSSPKLDLYFFASCPFCVMVLNEIKDLKIKVNYCDIMNSHEHLQKLEGDTGRRTVPCLYIDGKPMHESSDIIDWLHKNQNNLEKEN